MNWLKHWLALLSLLFFLSDDWVVLVILNLISIGILYLDRFENRKTTLESRMKLGLASWISVLLAIFIFDATLVLFSTVFDWFPYTFIFTYNSIINGLLSFLLYLPLLLLPLSNSFIAFREARYKGSKVKRDNKSYERLEDKENDDIAALEESMSTYKEMQS